MTTKQLILRGVYSLLTIAVSCTIFGGIQDFETIPAWLLAVPIMTPGVFLFLLVAKLSPSYSYLKHVAYFGYWGTWVALGAYVYSTAVELPEIGLLVIAIVSVAGFFGYLPLVWNGRFSLRALLIFTTIFATLPGFIVYVVKHV